MRLSVFRNLGDIDFYLSQITGESANYTSGTKSEAQKLVKLAAGEGYQLDLSHSYEGRHRIHTARFLGEQKTRSHDAVTPALAIVYAFLELDNFIDFKKAGDN